MGGYVRHVSRGIAIALIAVSAGVGLTACGDDQPTNPPASRTPGPTTPAVDPSVAALQGEALRVYRGYLGALTVANAAGDSKSAELRNFLGDPLRSEVAFYMQKDFDRGNYYQGEIRPVETQVTAMSLTTVPKNITVSGCLDYSNYRLVKRKDSTPVPNTTAFGRVPSTATVTEYVNGQWLVSASTVSWSKSC